MTYSTPEYGDKPLVCNDCGCVISVERSEVHASFHRILLAHLEATDRIATLIADMVTR